MPRFEIGIQVKKESATEGVLVIGPLERGFGHTIGNAIRRVLHSYLPGAAVTEMRIDGVPHEISSIKGVKEDVIEIMQNVKKINFKMTSLKPQIVTLEASGIGEVKAGDLKCPTGVEVLDKNLTLANLTDKKSKLKMELKVEFGRGYRLLDQQKSKVGVILLDADFSPVRKVTYRVESARVGRVTDLDQIVFELTTDGSMKPVVALQQAAAVLEEQFALLSKGVEVQRVWEETQETKKEAEKKPATPVYLEEFNLPTRLLNALKEAGIQTVEDVKKSGEEGLLKIKNVGPKSVNLIKESIEEKKNA